jgi:ABC-type uncharacterized transport system substrate-binding protein
MARPSSTRFAQVNITSLKEYDYYTYACADGKAVKFSAPTDYWLEYKNAAPTLHFTSPVKAPTVAKAHADRNL